MVRYERPSLASRCCGRLATNCFPFYNGLRRPFKPKIYRLVIALLFCTFAFMWMVLCGKLAAYRSDKNNTSLPDILFDVLPEKKLYPLPDVIIYTLLTSVLGRIIFHSNGVAIARRFAIISGTVYILRGFLLFSTSLPNPQSNCQAYTQELTFTGVLSRACTDMAGHTVNVVLAALCWGQYSKHKFVGATAWTLALSAIFAILFNRGNYTLDILYSLLISVFIWKFYHLVLALPVEHQNVIVRWFEKPERSVGEAERSPELSPIPMSKYKDLDDGVSSSPVTNRFIELTESITSLGSSDPSYKELSCVIK